MKYSQNSKIMQISEKTLIIGVDIASEVHFARAFDYRGVELAKILRFTNDEPGFKEFAAWVEEIKSKNHKDKVTVGMEPTGHYWFNIAPFLKDHSMKIVLVNPFHVKRSKELDDNNPTKNDRKDPKTIAMLVKDGRYMEPYIPEGVYSELRTAMDVLNRYGIRVQYETLVPAVRNRTDTGFCPMETAVLPVDEPEQALEILRAKRAELQKQMKTDKSR